MLAPVPAHLRGRGAGRRRSYDSFGRVFRRVRRSREMSTDRVVRFTESIQRLPGYTNYSFINPRKYVRIGFGRVAVIRLRSPCKDPGRQDALSQFIVRLRPLPWAPPTTQTRTRRSQVSLCRRAQQLAPHRHSFRKHFNTYPLNLMHWPLSPIRNRRRFTPFR